MTDQQFIEESFSGAPLAALPPHGMGDLGLFDSPDVATWGIGEWSFVGIGAYLAISAYNDSKTVARSVKRNAARTKRKVSSSANKTTKFAGQVAILAGIAAAAYVAYQYVSTQSSS